VLLDAAVAALAWAVATSLVRHGLPTVYGTATWVGFAMALNLAFRYTRQHFRLLDLMEARSFLAGTLTMVALLMVASAVGDRTGAPLESRDLLLVAGLLTCPLWLTLRLGFVAAGHRRARGAGRAPRGPGAGHAPPPPPNGGARPPPLPGGGIRG
jgi:hypothetical protein